MTPNDDRELEVIDGALAALFAADQRLPPAFTADVLRRIQDERWRRDTFLDRVFYAGLCTSGTLILIGLWFASSAVTAALQADAAGASALSSVVNLSGDTATKVALVGFVLAVIATWRRRGDLLR